MLLTNSFLFDKPIFAGILTEKQNIRKPMLLQEIFKPEYANLSEIYGLSLDEESLKTEFSSPPDNFDSIGFVIELDSDNLISNRLLDRLIPYQLTNINVVVEVPSQLLAQKVITPKYLIQVAHNVDFSISLLPPGHALVGESITNEEYIEVIRLFTEEMNKKAIFERFVCPISNFMEYLMIEKLLGADHPAISRFTPDNEYIKTTFASLMTHEQSNAFKDVIRQNLYNLYGGEENFNVVADVIFKAIYDKSGAIFKEHVNSYVNQQQSNAVSPEQVTNSESATPQTE